MNREMSFGKRLDAGWTKEQLMAHYVLIEAQYEKILGCLNAIKKVGAKV